MELALCFIRVYDTILPLKAEYSAQEDAYIAIQKKGLRNSSSLCIIKQTIDMEMRCFDWTKQKTSAEMRIYKKIQRRAGGDGAGRVRLLPSGKRKQSPLGQE